MELKVYKTDGKATTKKVTLDDALFGVTPNDHAIYLDVKQYLANQRQGTHSTKEKSTLSGSTRKIKRQKGTGSARAGSIKNPLFRGGARIFGPQPRVYSFKLNKKLKRLARQSALAYKAQENGIVVLEDFSFEAPRTKDYSQILKNFELGDKKTLMILPEQMEKENITLSARNIKNTKVITASSINTYEIMKASNLLMLESSVKDIEKMFATE